MIQLKNVTLTYGQQTILQGQELTVLPGESIALMGPSGCGKTSLLRLIAGLLKPSDGTVSISPGPIAVVFQEPRLLPWLTAEENVNIVLSDHASTLSEARHWLEEVSLQEAIKKYPRELSGGMQQRVSLARALAYRGEILLLDEPLKGLDAPMKEHVLTLLKAHTAGKTLLLATHDPVEAEALTETRYIYQAGRFVKEK